MVEEGMKSMGDAGSILKMLFPAVKNSGRMIYLIIDEYDHFANDIIAMGDGEFYKDIIRSSGFVRDFYEAVKIGAESVIDRIFITGISPIMLDDMTSGFNISTNITMSEMFNEMLGFTENELTESLSRLNIKKEGLGLHLKEYYNGYLFSAKSINRVYNPDMALYYLNSLVHTNMPPEQLMDDNVKTDYGRMNRLASNENNKKILGQIIKDEYIVCDIVSKFSFDRMYDDEYFVSLLFYMGMLTIDKKEHARLQLKIPNYVVKTLYWEYMDRMLRDRFKIHIETAPLRTAIEDMAFEGRIGPFLDYISDNVLKVLSNRDLIEFDEKYIKVILFSYLASGNVYKINSERETNSGYIDCFLEKDERMPDVKYEWLLELKYLKKGDADKLEQVKQEGMAQISRYAAAKGFDGRENLKQALLIFIGKDKYVVVEKV